MVECCMLVFCNYNGLIRVGLGCESCLTIINLLSLGISIPSWGAAVFGSLWFHCNKDSFVKILLLGGTQGFWEEKVCLFFFPPLFSAFPFLAWWGSIVSVFPSPRLLFVLSLDLLLVPLFLHVVKVSFCVTRSLFSRPYCEWRASVCCLILAMLGSQLGCN